MLRSHKYYLLSLVLVLAVSGVSAWQMAWGPDETPTPPLGSESHQAPGAPAIVEKEVAVTLPGDPKAVVVAVGPQGFVGWDFQVQVDGITTFQKKRFDLSAVEVQGLLRYIIREKQFFAMRENHVDAKRLQEAIELSQFKDMTEEDARDRLVPKMLRVEADGQKHEVAYWGVDHLPSTPERERLKAILGQIETVKAAANKTLFPLPEDPRTPIVRIRERNSVLEIRADGQVVDKGVSRGSLAAAQLQDLLVYIIREKKFFAIKKAQHYLPVGDPAVCIGSGELRLQVDGKDHVVEYIDCFAGNPATDEGKRLNDILARIAQARLLARTDAPKPGVEEKPGELPAAPRRLGSVLELFEDDTAPFIKELQTADGNSTITREEKDVFAGTSCLRVSPVQRYNPSMPGWKIRVTEKPADGEYRYLRFAWKKLGGQSIMLQLHANNNNTWHHRYFAGTNMRPDWGPAIQVGAEVPAQWQVVTRDLFQDFGAFELTGIALTPFDGTAGLFDHVYLGQSPEDLDRIDATGRSRQRPTEALSRQQLDQLWADLADADASLAYRAFWSLVGAGKQAAGLCREKLLAPPAVHVAAAQWIDELDNNDLRVREEAMAKLRQLGMSAAPALRAALARLPSLEAQRRIDQLLKAFAGEQERDHLRQQKAIRILEQIGSAEARKVLEDLAAEPT